MLATIAAGALALVLYALACARAARLVTTDTITARVREWATERADARAATRPLAALLDCDWCVSVWIAGALAACDALARGPVDALGASLGAPGWLWWPITIAALAQLAGMLTNRT